MEVYRLEEKKAIEQLNKRYDFFKENPLATNVWLTLDIHNLGIVLNLIEKQSKEIEEVKQKEKQAYINGTNIADKLCNKKWEDKIKAKIEEVKDGTYDAKIVLQSLLEKE